MTQGKFLLKHSHRKVADKSAIAPTQSLSFAKKQKEIVEKNDWYFFSIILFPGQVHLPKLRNSIFNLI